MDTNRHSRTHRGRKPGAWSFSETSRSQGIPHDWPNWLSRTGCPRFTCFEFSVAGGLLSYGPDHLDILDLAAQYVDKILNGANPAELPVRRPTKFHLAINLKTAEALQLKVPRSMIQLADELIDS